MISELKISKTELQEMVAHLIWRKMEKDIDIKDVQFRCDLDFELEYAYVIIDLGE